MAEKPKLITTTNWRVNFSALFLLAATVSVVSETTNKVQEVYIDIIHNEDGSSSRWHDRVHDAVWLHQSASRRRRMLTGTDRQTVIDTLNRLRRSLGSPDMYYAVRSRSFLAMFMSMSL